MTTVIDAETLLLVLLVLDLVHALVLHFFLESVRAGLQQFGLLLEDWVYFRFYFQSWNEAAVLAQVEDGQDLV